MAQLMVEKAKYSYNYISEMEVHDISNWKILDLKVLSF